ncbi:MAG: 4-hydroxy-tetrahydrodipicolinate reductase, partial [Chlorobi bacterium]|nr:4-hydroxy-tetrahydrodipicolinate reductase [Chlorobiota bacterium]
MRIALIGYGKMGKEIEKIAIERGHEIIFKFDITNNNEFTTDNLKKVDVAIEFTQPDSAYKNYLKCFEANIPVVSGTTGWLDNLPNIKSQCEGGKQTFFYASNFSLGVNLFFKLNKTLAQLMNKVEAYDVEISETHHTEKKDAPSGTAITLAEDIISNFNKKETWVKENAVNNSELVIHSYRKDKVPGLHTIKYESDVDYIEITHSAKSRKGFALGAVLAAEFTQKKSGFLTMNDLLD